MSKMFTFGDCQIVGNTQPSLLIRVFSCDLLSLDHLRGFGEPGHRPNAAFPLVGGAKIGVSPFFLLNIMIRDSPKCLRKK